MHQISFVGGLNLSSLPTHTSIQLGDEEIEVRIDSYNPESATANGFVLQFSADGPFAQMCTEQAPVRGTWDITMALSNLNWNGAAALFGFVPTAKTIFCAG